MKLISSKRRMAVVGLAVGLIAGASGLAFAYFTSSGSGSGSAQTGTGTNVTISQVGAGYDSLIPSNSYTEDQCLQGCTGPSEFGNDITLANSGSYQQLTSVVLAVRNWGPAIVAAPITLSINNTVAGPFTTTQTFNVPAAILANTKPSTTDLTFELASSNLFVAHELVYGFSFGNPLLAATGTNAGEASLNIALSSSGTNLLIGTDTTPGTINLADSNGNNNDFPVCMNADFPTSGFISLVTNCGPSQEFNAYGTAPQVAAGSDDIPAVEFNVVGGSALELYPGGPPVPVSFAITNPGSSPVFVNAVTTTAASVTTGLNGSIEACNISMYSIGTPTVTVGTAVAPGTTVFDATGTSISMTDDGHNQDNCEGQVVTLGFASN
jgi:hypothetical protein